jgi:cobalamin synthase
MSTAAIALWILAALLFIAAVTLVVLSVVTLWRKLARLGHEVGGLSGDVEQAVGSPRSERTGRLRA